MAIIRPAALSHPPERRRQHLHPQHEPCGTPLFLNRELKMRRRSDRSLHAAQCREFIEVKFRSENLLACQTIKTGNLT